MNDNKNGSSNGTFKKSQRWKILFLGINYRLEDWLGFYQSEGGTKLVYKAFFSSSSCTQHRTGTEQNERKTVEDICIKVDLKSNFLGE